MDNFSYRGNSLPSLSLAQVGGAVERNQFFFRLQYEEGDEEEGGCLRRLHRRKMQSVPGLNNCIFVDGVVNYFLARTDAVRRVGFDPFLKRVAHTGRCILGVQDDCLVYGLHTECLWNTLFSYFMTMLWEKGSEKLVLLPGWYLSRENIFPWKFWLTKTYCLLECLFMIGLLFLSLYPKPLQSFF